MFVWPSSQLGALLNHVVWVMYTYTQNPYILFPQKNRKHIYAKFSNVPLAQVPIHSMDVDKAAPLTLTARLAPLISFRFTLMPSFYLSSWKFRTEKSCLYTTTYDMKWFPQKITLNIVDILWNSNWNEVSNSMKAKHDGHEISNKVHEFSPK